MHEAGHAGLYTVGRAVIHMAFLSLDHARFEVGMIVACIGRDGRQSGEHSGQAAHTAPFSGQSTFPQQASLFPAVHQSVSLGCFPPSPQWGGRSMVPAARGTFCV